MSEQLTIAIITFNRPQMLMRCLKSIARQTMAPDVVLVIDNDRDKSAEEVCRTFQQKGLEFIQYIHEPVKGYATARNAALRHCLTPLLGFVDDDCVLASGWVSSVRKAFKEQPGLAYVVGRVDVVQQGNFFSDLACARHDYFVQMQLEEHSNRIETGWLDTKNLAVAMTFIRHEGIWFDEKFNIGGEDVDFGQMILSRHGVGFYEQEMVVAHDECNSFFSFFGKAFCYGRTRYLLCRKWQPQGQLLHWDTPRRRNIPLFFRRRPYVNETEVRVTGFFLAAWVKVHFVGVYGQSIIDKVNNLLKGK